MSSKEDKERSGRERLEKIIREDNHKRGRDISSREVESIIQRVQHKTDIQGRIK